MADNKLSWSELRRLLMERASVSEKDATAFMNGLQSQLIEALKTDKQVRINGLGTFRLQPVASRKSVDVSTGEEITIEGYNKIIFAPEAGVRELVEKVAEVSSQPAETDPLQKLGVQAEEIKDILGELGQSPEEPAEEEPIAEEPEAEESEKTEVTQTTIISQTTIINNMETETTTTPEEPRYVRDPEPAYVPEPAPVESEEEKEFVYTEKKESHWLRNTLIILLILLLIACVCAYFFLPRPMLQEWKDKAVSLWPWSNQTEQPVSNEDGGIDSDILAEFEAISANDDGEEFWDEIVYDQLITTERMHEASRLCWMSFRFYGDKRYWPYLYDANKDHLDDPNRIDVGTPIRVPKLTAEQRDLNNETTRRHLEYLKRRAEKKMK